MFGGFRELLSGRGTSGTERKAFHHEFLGTINFNEDTGLWETVVHAGDDVVSFAVGGTTTPSGVLMAEAVRILEDYLVFKDNIRRFLQTEALRIADYTNEIRQLDIEQVVLSVPTQPHRGILYFTGPDEERVWRCDLLQGQPKRESLDFDD